MNQLKHKHRNDVIFIAVLLVLVSLGGAAFYFFRAPGDTVTVTVDIKLYGTYSLDTDITVDIRGAGGENAHNRLVIRDGKAYVEEASCPDGICASHKPISREGESIVCLPHRVVITVQTAQGENEPDIIA